jgi:hypothetical protein
MVKRTAKLPFVFLREEALSASEADWLRSTAAFFLQKVTTRYKKEINRSVAEACVGRESPYLLPFPRPQTFLTF